MSDRREKETPTPTPTAQGPKTSVCDRPGCGKPVCFQIPEGNFCAEHGKEASGYRPFVDPYAAPERPAQFADARCPKCQLVPCGCARGERPAPFGEKPTDIPVDQIFEGITLDSINAWRDLEQAERERLAGELQDKQRREAEQTAYEISKITQPHQETQADHNRRRLELAGRPHWRRLAANPRPETDFNRGGLCIRKGPHVSRGLRGL